MFFAMSMANLTIGSVNCRGLASDEIKRRDIFHKYKQLYDITFLIDTHCSKEKKKSNGKPNGGTVPSLHIRTNINQGQKVTNKNLLSLDMSEC